MPAEQGGTAGLDNIGSRSGVPLPLSLPPNCHQQTYDAEYARMESWMDENPDFVQDYFIRYIKIFWRLPIIARAFPMGLKFHPLHNNIYSFIYVFLDVLMFACTSDTTLFIEKQQDRSWTHGWCHMLPLGVVVEQLQVVLVSVAATCHHRHMDAVRRARREVDLVQQHLFGN